MSLTTTRARPTAPRIVVLSVGLPMLIMATACGDDDDKSAASAEFCEAHALFTERRNEALAGDPGSEGTVTMKRFLTQQAAVVAELQDSAPDAVGDDVRTMLDSYERYAGGDRAAVDPGEKAAARVDAYARANCTPD